MKIRGVGRTDPGLRRHHNEDAFTIASDCRYCAVADGVGGGAAGEVASAIFTATVDALLAYAELPSEEELAELVGEAFRQGHEKILLDAGEHPENKGMGCTAELLAFHRDRFTLGHVGDSRTYLFRNGALQQLTKDHSLVQSQLDQGLISPDQARRHPLKHVILRALGLEHSLSFDLVRGQVAPGDIFLLCSDGLSDMVEDAEITRILSMEIELRMKVDMLVHAAFRGGGKDNVTVVLCLAVP